MRIVIVFLFCLINICGLAQQKSEYKLEDKVKQFHIALLKKNYSFIEQHTDKALSYGHSNGWVQTQSDLINDFKNGVISYEKFTEDSITVQTSNNVASVRFIADVEATLRGNAGKYHLKVLEVWLKKGKQWILFARQAVK